MESGPMRENYACIAIRREELLQTIFVILPQFLAVYGERNTVCSAFARSIIVEQ